MVFKAKSLDAITKGVITGGEEKQLFVKSGLGS